MNKLFLVSFLVLSLTQSVFAAPAQVILIRHAEKPDHGDQVSQQGCERAFALTQFFTTNSIVTRYGQPVAVFAQGLKKPKSSVRPIQTMAPIARQLGLTLLAPFDRDDFALLVKHLMGDPEYNGKTVILAWEHDVIPAFARELGASSGANSSGWPYKWPDHVFDEAWVVQLTPGAVSLEIIPEYVLPGDNPQGGDQWKEKNLGSSQAPAINSSISNACADNSALNSIVKQVIAR